MAVEEDIIEYDVIELGGARAGKNEKEKQKNVDGARGEWMGMQKRMRCKGMKKGFKLHGDRSCMELFFLKVLGEEFAIRLVCAIK